jgi:asparagine synthase (glutamine-hydrolysing)
VRGARIAFASEPKALVAAFPEERRPDRQLVHDFVAGGVPDGDDHTFFENIRSVPPGQLLSIGLTHETTRRYWNFQPGQEVMRPDAPEAFLALLQDAVSVRLRSDVPVGVALSGGLDSSAVARLAADATHQTLQCFSLRYPSASLDESAYARLVADDPARYRIHWVTPAAEDLVATTAAIVWHHDAPTPIRGRYPQWHVLREAGKHVTVVLGGQGADELLGGYPRFVLPYALDRLDPLLACARSKWALARELVELGRVSTGIHRMLPGLALAAITRRLGVFPGRHAFAFDGPIGNRPVLHHRFIGASGGPMYERPYRSRLNNALWNELRSAGLPEVLHSEDAISMAFSLESRLPFLDHRIVEFCFSLAYGEKIGEGWTKLLLRRAASRPVPEAVRLRRRKLGFPGDYAAWLAGAENFESVRDILLDQTTLERGWLDRAWLRHRMGGPRRLAQHWVRRHLQLVWKLLTLELWCRLYLDNDLGMRPAAPADRRDASRPLTKVHAGGSA